ncbi:Dynein light chain [Meloidogyne graminicola]|uniref:Dynein light chain n=1 Tax=Meloidogyne graminicola TaxID=189291 RepID=A0A8S9ZT51_9BILA|nr:Dynein light chain [Meloidogyne graminicola]KAF7636655.1 Dynein light chain [Meloidogyne graminicola]
MSKEMETQAIYFSIRAIMKHKETMEIAKCIEKKLNKKYGKDWCCNIGGNFGAFVPNKPNHFIHLKLDQFVILLFKTP